MSSSFVTHGLVWMRRCQSLYLSSICVTIVCAAAGEMCVLIVYVNLLRVEVQNHGKRTLLCHFVVEQLLMISVIVTLSWIIPGSYTGYACSTRVLRNVDLFGRARGFTVWILNSREHKLWQSPDQWVWLSLVIFMTGEGPSMALSAEVLVEFHHVSLAMSSQS